MIGQWVLMLAAVVAVGVYSARHAGDAQSVTDGVLLVHEVEVTGSLETRLNDEVSGLLQDLVGSPILDVSLAETQKRALSHPWIRAATALRSLPNKIKVAIEPRRAVALLQSKTGLRVLGDQGETILAEGALPSVPIIEEGSVTPQLTALLSDWSKQSASIIEQVKLKASQAKLVVNFRESRIIIQVDLTQSFGWISSLDRALDAALATALERRIAVRYITVIDDKKFVVKTS